MSSIDNPILRDLRSESGSIETPLSWVATAYLSELHFWDATPEQKDEARKVIARLADPLDPDLEEVI